MRIELLPKDLTYYKANLHSHSTLSDGSVTPEQMKEGYKAKGYSILAITDHNVFLPHNDLTEDDFLVLNGLEYNIDPNDGSGRTCHFCAIAGDKNTVLQPLFHRTKYCVRGAVESRAFVKYDESLPDYERIYTGEGVSEMMKVCRDAGFFVTYNHPCWSVERYPEYMSYDGMHAMEIVNYGSVETGYPEVNEQVYDDMLIAGKRVFCSANDDNHTVQKDAFGGFNYILSPGLTYESVMEALFAGRYYASNGPRITALYAEDGTVHIEVPGAREIRVFTGFRRASRKIGTPDAPVTELQYTPDEKCRYVRFAVVDFEGKTAFTRAYFPDELGIALPKA